MGWRLTAALPIFPGGACQLAYDPSDAADGGDGKNEHCGLHVVCPLVRESVKPMIRARARIARHFFINLCRFGCNGLA